MFAAAVGACALLAWAGILLLPWQPHRTRERLEPEAPRAFADLGDIAVLIPARNEADVIGSTLRALGRQGPNLRVYVIDDESTDATRAVCAERQAAQTSAAGAAPEFALDVAVIDGAPLPDGWGGKLWALQQGLDRVERPYTLLLDADIELAPGVVAQLLRRARATGAQLVSVMALLRCVTFWERLLVPPFVFFFKLLYPFARVNEAATRTAAAAGGCILVETRVLHEVGAFAAIRGALIDDCSLAARVKRGGRPIWLGLSRSVVSQRAYPDLRSFWQMVSRTAYTQLRYSPALLLAVTLVMAVIFAGPFIALLAGSRTAMTAGALAIAAMAAAYLPVVRYYRLPFAWALTLPAAGTLFLAMTWSSALNYWRGVRAQWKSRAYAASGR